VVQRSSLVQRPCDLFHQFGLGIGFLKYCCFAAGEYLDRWWQANLSNPKAMVEWLRGINIESITAWTSALGGALLHRLFLFLVG
jgi:hypothetical protein